MKVMVTGGAGFIGSHILARLVRAGHDVAVIDDLSTGRLANLDPALDAGMDPRHWYVGDIRQETTAAKLRAFRPDVLIHLAAQVSVERSVCHPAIDADVNITGTINMLAAAQEAGCRRVVFASSCAIYGEVSDLPVDEDHSYIPTTPYGLAKATAMRYLAWYAMQYQLRPLTLVIGNVYGPRQRPEVGGVIVRFVDALSRGRVPTINGDGQQTRDFVYVADVADAFVLAVEADVTGAINIGSGAPTTVNEILRLTTSAMGAAGEPRHSALIPGEIPAMTLSIERARWLLGWSPLTPLDVGIRQLAAAHRQTLEGSA